MKFASIECRYDLAVDGKLRVVDCGQDAKRIPANSRRERRRDKLASPRFHGWNFFDDIIAEGNSVRNVCAAVAAKDGNRLIRFQGGSRQVSGPACGTEQLVRVALLKDDIEWDSSRMNTGGICWRNGDRCVVFGGDQRELTGRTDERIFISQHEVFGSQHVDWQGGVGVAAVFFTAKPVNGNLRLGRHAHSVAGNEAVDIANFGERGELESLQLAGGQTKGLDMAEARNGNRARRILLGCDEEAYRDRAFFQAFGECQPEFGALAVRLTTDCRRDGRLQPKLVVAKVVIAAGWGYSQRVLSVQRQCREHLVGRDRSDDNGTRRVE